MNDIATPLDYFHRGYEAAQNGMSRSSCALLHEGWPRKCWYEGYNFFDKSNDFMEFSPTEDAEYSSTRVSKSPYEQGRDAFGDKRHLSTADCPYGPDTPAHDDWCRGWQDALEAATAAPQLNMSALVARFLAGECVLTIGVNEVDKRR